MKTLIARLSVCLLLACLANAETTEVILARMDKSALSFQGVTADLKMTTYNKLLDDKTVESGTLQMQRTKSREVRAVVDFSQQTDARIIGFEGKNIRLYYPKLDQFNETSLGKDGNLLNSFLLLGFGSSGKELAANYEITNQGVEKLGPLGSTKLLLIPKNPAVKERIEKVQIWIGDGQSYPTQPPSYHPAGNYHLVTYSNIVINPPGQKKVELKMPGTAKRMKQ